MGGRRTSAATCNSPSALPAVTGVGWLMGHAHRRARFQPGAGRAGWAGEPEEALAALQAAPPRRRTSIDAEGFAVADEYYAARWIGGGWPETSTLELGPPDVAAELQAAAPSGQGGRVMALTLRLRGKRWRCATRAAGRWHRRRLQPGIGQGIALRPARRG